MFFRLFWQNFESNILAKNKNEGLKLYKQYSHIRYIRLETKNLLWLKNRFLTLFLNKKLKRNEKLKNFLKKMIDLKKCQFLAETFHFS